MAGPSLLVRIMGDAKDFNKSINETQSVAGKVSSAVGSTLKNAFQLASTAMTAAGVAAVGFGIESFKTAARVGEMDATLRALAKGNETVYANMQATVKAIRSTGIEAGVAQGLVAQFTRNQLDLSKATDLARVAQDAAVISGQNSTETLEQLVHGITTQNSMVLRNAGINVQAGQAVDAYAKSVNKATKDLSDSERAQAVLNAVIQAGVPIAGAYTAAMEEPGKVLRSFPRLFNDIQVTVGKGLVDAFGPFILKLYEIVKAFSAAIQEGGNLRPILDEITKKVQELVKPLTELATKAGEWIKKIPPDVVEKIAGSIGKLGSLATGAASAIATFGIQRVPILGTLLGGINPVVAGLAGFILTTDGGRKAIGTLLDAVKPLLPALADLAKTLATGLGDILPKIALLVAEVLAGFAPLLPVITDIAKTVLDVLVPALGFLVDLLAKNSDVVVPLIGFFLGFAGAIKAVMVIVKLETAIMVLIPKLYAMGVAMWAALGPFGLIAGAVVGLVAALVIAYKKIDWFRDGVDAAIGGVVTAFNWLIDAAKKVLGWVKSNWPYLLLALTGPIGAAIAVFLKFREQIIGFFAGIAEKVLGILSTGWNSVLGFFVDLPGRIVDALKALPGLLGDLFVLAIQTAIFVIAIQILAVYKLFTDIIPNIVKSLVGLGGALIGVFVDAMVALPGQIAKGAVGTYRFFEELIPKILSFIANLPGVLLDLGKRAILAFIEAHVNAAVGLWRFFADLVPRIISYLNNLAGSLAAKGTDAMVALLNAIVTAAKAVIDFFFNLPGRLVGFFTELPGKLYNLGRDMIQGLIDGIGSLASAVTNKVKEVVTAPIDKAKSLLKIGSPSRVFAEMGRDTVAGYIQGIEQMANRVEPALSGALTPSASYGGLGGDAGPAVQIGEVNLSKEVEVEEFTRQLAWYVQTARI